MPQISVSGNCSRIGRMFSGSIYTPHSAFLAMCVATFANVFVGANPTLTGTLTHLAIRVRISRPNAI